MILRCRGCTRIVFSDVVLANGLQVTHKCSCNLWLLLFVIGDVPVVVASHTKPDVEIYPLQAAPRGGVRLTPIGEH